MSILKHGNITDKCGAILEAFVFKQIFQKTSFLTQRTGIHKV